jgi:small GTP-binding protein
MIQKKICMLGASAVGKTSLVERFVKSMFSEKYLTTVGVKIDKKEVRIDSETVNLVLWDLNGEDEFQRLRMSYLRGASGYFLVVDGTRRDTLDHAVDLQRRAEGAIGNVPFVLLLNKGDVKREWELDDRGVQEITARGWPVLETSAKTGSKVEEAFLTLARGVLTERNKSQDPAGKA